MLQENNKNMEEIELSEFFFSALKYWRKIIIIGLIFALLMGVYKFIPLYKSLNSGQKTIKTSENVEMLKKEVNKLKSSVNEKSEHLNKSIYYNLNPYNYFKGELLYNIKSENLNITRSLITSYVTFIENSDIYEKINIKLNKNYKIRDLKEIVNYNIYEEEGNIKISICFYNEKSVQNIIDVIKNEINNQTEKFNSQFGIYNINLIQETMSNDVDTVLAQKIENEIKSLNELKATLNGKQTQYDNLVSKEKITIKSIIISSLKFVILGFIIGSLLVFSYYCLAILVTKKIKSSKQLENCYDAKILGEFSDEWFNKRKITKFDLKIAKYYGGIINIPEEEVYNIVTNNVQALANDNKKILLTGSINKDQIESVFNKLSTSELNKKYEFSVGKNPLYSGNTLKKVSDSDAIILVEKRGKTLIKEFEKQIKVLQNYDKQIIGIILL